MPALSQQAWNRAQADFVVLGARESTLSHYALRFLISVPENMFCVTGSAQAVSRP